MGEERGREKKERGKGREKREGEDFMRFYALVV